MAIFSQFNPQNIISTNQNYHDLFLTLYLQAKYIFVSKLFIIIIIIKNYYQSSKFELSLVKNTRDSNCQRNNQTQQS